jgi:molybdate transport system substrate-binding protein
MFHRIAVAISIAVALVFAVATAGAAELKVMGAGPVEGTVKELLPAFVRETGHKVEGVFNTVGIIQDRLKAGERPDILILSAPVMEAMEKDGSLVAGSRTEVGRATSGFAVRAGAPTPDISTPDAMKKTLLAARTVAYVDPAGGGTTGVFFAGLLTRLGISDEINRKAIRPQRGAQVAEAVADGREDVEMQRIERGLGHRRCSAKASNGRVSSFGAFSASASTGLLSTVWPAPQPRSRTGTAARRS